MDRLGNSQGCSDTAAVHLFDAFTQTLEWGGKTQSLWRKKRRRNNLSKDQNERLRVGPQSRGSVPKEDPGQSLWSRGVAPFSGGAVGGAVQPAAGVHGGGAQGRGAALGLGEALVVSVQTEVLHRHQFTVEPGAVQSFEGLS